MGGKNTTRCRTAIRNLMKSTQKKKATIRAKNVIKAKHLEKKFIKKKKEGRSARILSKV